MARIVRATRKAFADGLGGPLAMENAPYDTEFDFHVCAMTRDQASMDHRFRIRLPYFPGIPNPSFRLSG